MPPSVVEPLTLLAGRVPGVRPALRRFAEPLAVTAYLVVLFVTLLKPAKVRLFWFDELFTLHLARSPLSLWGNLAGGVDNNPPLSYLLTAACVAVFGEVEWAVRLPSVLGAAVGCGGLYLFVRHRRGPAEAFLAMTAVSASAAVWVYFLEARPYGLMIGLTAVALVCWQRGRTLGFAAALVLGLASHYFFVVPIAAFGLAEVVRTIQNRRLDRGMAAAFVAAGVALAALYPLWGYGPQAYAAGFWAKVKLGRPAVEGAFQEFYRPEVVLPVVLALGVGVIAGRRADAGEPYPLAEAVAIAALAAGPLLGVVVGAKVTGAFYYRYVLPAVLGLAGVFAFAVGRAGGTWAAVVAAGGFVWFGLTGDAKPAVGHYRAEAAQLHDTAAFLKANAGGTVLVESPFEFGRLWHYHADLPTGYVADVGLAMKHTKADTVDRGLRSLSRIAPLPLLTPDEVAAKLRAGERFDFFGPRAGWQAQELAARGVTFTPVATRGNGTLYRLGV